MTRMTPDIHCLRKSLEQLSELITSATPYQVDPMDDEGFRVVAGVFLATAAEYFRAAQTLLKAQHCLAAVVTGRTMFEGMTQLLWMNQDRESRAMKWRAWAHVVDWRTLQMRDREGLPVTSQERERVEGNIRVSGRLFRKSKPKGSDPYVINWTPPIWRMAKDIGLYDLYDSVYQEDSQLVHWATGGLARSLIPQGSKLACDFAQERLEIRAINTVFHSAWHMFYNAARWFDLGAAPERFDSVRETFVNCYERRTPV